MFYKSQHKAPYDQAADTTENKMSQVRDLEWGTHVFVFARPLSGDWTEVDGTFLRDSGEAEFRPCLIRGINEG